MIRYIAYDEHDAETVRGECLDETFAFLETIYPRIVQVAEHPANVTFLDGETIVERPAPPSDCHDWDWTTKTWQPKPDDARAKKKAAIAVEQSRRSVSPITYAGSLFDADATARERISGTLSRLLRGDGLPAGWVGWRDFENAMHWTSDTPEQVQTQLAGLSAAIEDREQALLIAAWTHKAALDALTDIGDILSYDTTADWPA